VSKKKNRPKERLGHLELEIGSNLARRKGADAALHFEKAKRKGKKMRIFDSFKGRKKEGY